MTDDRDQDRDVSTPTLAGSVDLTLCRELADLEEEKESLDLKKKRINKQIASIWERLYPQLVGRKCQNLEDGVRVQPKRSLLVNKRSGVSTEEVVAALKQTDFDWLVREDYESGKLKEHIGELDAAAVESGDIPDKISDLLPPELAPFFSVYEKKACVVVGVKAKAKTHLAKEERRKEVDRGERKAD